jgi:hypothetical protein
VRAGARRGWRRCCHGVKRFGWRVASWLVR